MRRFRSARSVLARGQRFRSRSRHVSRVGVVVSTLVISVVAAGDRGVAREQPHRAARTSSDSSAVRKCRPAEARAPRGPAAQAVSLGRVNGHDIEAVVYPHPKYKGDPWSQWGQGLALDDGRFISAVGDHRGQDGNSYLFVYEPSQHRLVQFTDVLSHVQHRPGEWGYGKIHAQMVLGPCGDAYVATYWGTDLNLRYGGSYKGDILFRLDTSTFELNELGVPVPQHGIPALAGFTRGGVLYGEAATPTPADAEGSMKGAFFAYNTRTGKVNFRADDNALTGFRNVLVDANGTAYLAGNARRLLVYKRDSNRLSVLPARLPAGWLRASTRPAPDGTVYGATQDPDRLFALHPDGRVDDLGAARGYTTSVALDPDGRRFFYVPGAAGDSWKQGTPLIAVDTKTGNQTTVATLNELAERKLGLTLAGTYSVSVTPSGRAVYIGMNAGPDRKNPWGEIVLIIVHLDG